MVLNIVKINDKGSEILRKKAINADINDHLISLVDNMIETLKARNFAGICAPEVGISQRIIIVNTEEGSIEIVNPRVINSFGEQISWGESCESIKNAVGFVERPAVLEIEGLNKYGKRVHHKFEGFHACVASNKIDCLNGVLFVDKAFRFLCINTKTDKTEWDAFNSSSNLHDLNDEMNRLQEHYDSFIAQTDNPEAASQADELKHQINEINKEMDKLYTKEAIFALIEKDMDYFEYCLKQNANINWLDENGQTELHKYAVTGNIVRLNMLLINKIQLPNINIEDKNNNTPLLIAVKKLNTTAIDLMLRKCITDTTTLEGAIKTAESMVSAFSPNNTNIFSKSNRLFYAQTILNTLKYYSADHPLRKIAKICLENLEFIKKYKIESFYNGSINRAIMRLNEIIDIDNKNFNDERIVNSIEIIEKKLINAYRGQIENIDKFPEDSIIIANAHFYVRGYKDAIRQCNQIIKNESNDTNMAFILRAKACYEAGNINKALNYCNEIIDKIDPNSCEIYKIRGNIKRVKGDLNSAMIDYSRIIELNNEFAQKNKILSRVEHLKREIELLP